MAETCLACGRPLDTDRFAVYHSDAKQNRQTEETEGVAGHLCSACAKQHKMKPVRRENPFAKLAHVFVDENEGNV